MTLAFRVALGTAVYALIVLTAAPFPAAAGLMLTFPALNGLAFVFAERAQVPGMARSMLWMPVLNGALCAGFILAFLMLAGPVAPAALAWVLAAAGAALFFAVGSLPQVRAGIPERAQFRYALAVTAGSAVLAAVAFAGPASPAPAPVPAGDFVTGTLARNAVKIALFALCLAGFLVATSRLPLSDGVRGVLGGLPVVPLGGLVSIAGDGGLALDARQAIFAGMAASVWFSPAMPVWFIYGFSRWLVATHLRGDAAKLLALAVAWALGALAVAAAAWLLSRG